MLLAAAALSAATPALAQNGAAQPAQERGVGWDRRPTVVFAEHSRIELRARLQTDYLARNDADPDAPALGAEDRLSMPRRRVGVGGVLFDRVEFQVEGEVGDAQPWRDVFADVKLHRALRVRAGRFKVPFSAEQLTSGTELDFIARSAAVTDLAPERDVGLMLHGRVAARAIKYEAGVFEVDGASRLWTGGAVRTLAGRVTVAPLTDGRSRGSDALEISAALLRSDLPEGRGGPSGHLAAGDTFFSRMFVNGTRTRMGAGVAWTGTRGALRGELVRSLDTRRGQGVDGGDLSDLVATGGYVSGIWHLAARGGRRWGRAPLRGLDLTARFDRLSFGSTSHGEGPFLNPRADRVAPIGRHAWTGGVNWYVNRWVKVQVNAVRERLVDPLALLALPTTPLWSAVVRFQVAM